MYILASFVKDKMSICAWIYLWAFYFVPLIYISVFVQVPYCLDNSGFVVEPVIYFQWLVLFFASQQKPTTISSLLRDYLLLYFPKKIKTSYLGIPPFFKWASVLHILSCLKWISHQSSGSFLLPFLLESPDYHLSQSCFQLL